jgi:5-hydroxyisourate hydrolase
VSVISTHVLDTSSGRPAAAVRVRLEALADDGWRRVAEAVTDADGRVPAVAEVATPGVYKLVFDSATYFGEGTFYPAVEIVFRVSDPTEHHHVPLLLSPYGYTTYRGS